MRYLNRWGPQRAGVKSDKSSAAGGRSLGSWHFLALAEYCRGIKMKKHKAVWFPQNDAVSPVNTRQYLPANVCLMFHLISFQSLLSSSPNTVNPAWCVVCWWIALVAQSLLKPGCHNQLGGCLARTPLCVSFTVMISQKLVVAFTFTMRCNVACHWFTQRLIRRSKTTESVDSVPLCSFLSGSCVTPEVTQSLVLFVNRAGCM